MKTHIEIPVSELKTALPGFSKVVPRSTSLPVLGCLKVALSEDGHTITLQAHNLDEIATLRLENKSAGQPGELLVPLDMLSKLIKGCSADQSIQLLGSEQETKIRYPVAGSLVDRVVNHIPAREWPEVKTIPVEPITLDVSFKQALREALESASTDSSRYVLNGACLDVRAKDAHYVVGTDGRHLYSANSFRFGLPESLIIPTRKFITWPAFVNDGPWKLRMLPGVKAKEGQKDVKEESSWLQIESERWTYTAKAIDGQYPNWQQVMPTDTAKWTRLILSPPAIAAMQQAIPLLPGADMVNQTVVLEIGTERLALRARGKEDKEDTRMLVADVRIMGKPVEVALNRNYLLKALRFGFNELRIDDSLTPVVFSSPSKTMVVMPVRMEGPAPAAAAPAATALESATEAQSSQASSEQPSPSESAQAVPPSAAGREATPTETFIERKDMSQNTMPAPQRGNLKYHNTNGNGNGSGAAEDNGSAMKAAIEKVESIRANLRQMSSDLTDALSLLKAAEKENKVASKEIATVRQTLRSLQSVAI